MLSRLSTLVTFFNRTLRSLLLMVVAIPFLTNQSAVPTNDEAYF